MTRAISAKVSYGQAVSRGLAAWIVLILAAMLTVGGQPAQARGTPDGFADLAERLLPAVVNISTQTRVRVRRHSLLDDPFFRRFFDFPLEQPREKRKQSLGSGVIVDAKKGYVLTNHHVIEGADKITVTLRDQRQVDAKIVGQDTEVDLALLRIKARNLKALPMADSRWLMAVLPRRPMAVLPPRRLQIPFGAAASRFPQPQLHVRVEPQIRKLFLLHFQVAGGGDHRSVVG